MAIRILDEVEDDREGNPAVCVVIPTYNRANRLPELFRRLASQTLDPNTFEVVVVDDASTDRTWDLLKEAAQSNKIRLRIARTTSNSGGPAAPRNIGWRMTNAPIVAFLDDDCLPDPHWLESGLAAFSARPDWGVLQGRTLPTGHSPEAPLQPWSILRSITGPTPWFEAVNIFYRRAALEFAGGFNESYGTWGEDTDLGWIAVDAGWGHGYDPAPTVHHGVEVRGWRNIAAFAWRDRHLVRVAADHPTFRRDAFWHPWVMRRQSFELLLAVAGLVASARWKPFAALVLPYFCLRRPSFRAEQFWRDFLRGVVIDATRLVGNVSASVRCGIFVI